jgi:hypothetical protein
MQTVGSPAQSTFAKIATQQESVVQHNQYSDYVASHGQGVAWQNTISNFDMLQEIVQFSSGHATNFGALTPLIPTYSYGGAGGSLSSDYFVLITASPK